MPKKARKNNAGFTLIELLVVISIISLLASVILVSTVRARWQAIDTKRVADVMTLAKAMDLYYQDKGNWPMITKYWPSNPQIVTSLDPHWKTELGVVLKPAYIQDMPNTGLRKIMWEDNEGYMVEYMMKSLTYTQTNPKGGSAVEVYKPTPHIVCMFPDSFMVGTVLVDPNDERINGRESLASEDYGIDANFLIFGGNTKNYPAGARTSCENGL